LYKASKNAYQQRSSEPPRSWDCHSQSPRHSRSADATTFADNWPRSLVNVHGMSLGRPFVRSVRLLCH
jgi:hypothetical protein